MQAQSDWLQERYGFDEWREISETEPSLVGIGFRFTGDELNGWRVHRSRTIQVAGAPPAVLSIWRPSGDGAGLLGVDVYETAAADAARSQLLRLLGEFQGPLLERETVVGDIAFRAGSSVLVFARGNYTVLVRSVEREPVPVSEIAQRLDQLLVASPDSVSEEGGLLRNATSPATGTVRPGQRVAIDLDMDQPAEGTAWIRFFARSGRILVEGGRAWYVAGPDGPRDIAVVAVDPDGGASRAVLHFEREGD